jgi:cyclopropane fatty-acyl-phospholipid synthase-like methyltransferase
MKEEIVAQQQYWNNQAGEFHRIYSHEKSSTSNFLDRVFRKDMYERFVYTITHSAPYEGRTYLDVGCGSGVYSVELATKGAQKVVGIDIAEHMLALCNDLARREKVADKCEFAHSDLLKYSARQKFDVVIGIGLFDYIGDALPVLKKMKDVAHDKVIVAFPRLWTWRAPIRKARLAMRGCNVYFYSRGKVARLMKEAGFARCEIEQVGKLFCVTGFVHVK